MAKQKIARLADLVGLLNGLYAPSLAEDWDNVGLQLGDPTTEIERILVCLDAEERALDEAERAAAKLVISHHPLIFKGLKRLTPADEPGRVIFRAIRNNIAIYSAHTNLDRAADGLNDWLAARLGLENCTPVERPQAGGYYKLVVYVPKGHEQEMMTALFAAGAGHIGEYDHCSFRTEGTGSFRGNDSTDPFIGQPGELEQTSEYRLETIVPGAALAKVVARMIKTHPYEEVAYDLIPLANTRSDIGLGRIGRLPQKVTLKAFAEQVKQQLNLPALRLVGDQGMGIEKVAVCGGSGASLLGDAIRLGADCLVTGDVKYHDAQRARSEGLALIDAGHFATEQIMVAELASRVRQALAERQLPVEVIEMTGEQDPFITC
ncbi:dinuclear metal center protein, YbgI/SA1388 family [Malonomonas rubra DSM 5091]|uniref:GTP cyclohydrolase 1 type 2 homolog n=1 Tax=Malonomonas rubra DSM 5091 TaxID=1122189 RepID=A0A1M6F900_MALRU|nr:Nif3-like dinuclear metal center hexameric protein [Malonomonas rubra]SHI94155.1 dinuclear metal center protein, YbgI/SA1388 family [Malonomonas rubra DSM 5091]